MKKILVLLLILIISSGFCQTLQDEGSLLAVLYHQTAAEYQALCYQAYNLAGDRLQNILGSRRINNPAIIIDVDETVLSNSVYNARELVQGQKYPDDFYTWLEEMNSQPIKGAYEFLTMADSLGVQIFYITNRRDHKQKATIGNLQKYNFPQADSVHVLCKEKESSKEPRRQKVMEEHEVLMLIGDNLLDFSDLFRGDTISQRFAAVEEWQQEFGRNYIILPNIMHGYWEKLIYDFERNLSAKELKAKRMKYLEY